jgi:hypothetical protein
LREDPGAAWRGCGDMRAPLPTGCVPSPYPHRDKKSLQSQVERLEKALEGCDAEHATRVDALRAEHGTAIAALRAELQAVHQGRVGWWWRRMCAGCACVL